jgi:chaperone modulatory protein CbpM
MEKHGLLIIADYSEQRPLTLEELHQIVNIPTDFIHHLVEFEIIHPTGASPEQWVFELSELKRIKTALHLHTDLEVNVAGIAVVMDLIEQLEDMRAEMELIRKHYL